MEQHWSYDLLKHIAINDTTAQDHLEEFKSMFRDDIGSTRNMSRIKTIDDLIDCLERHDVLSEQNIEPLREIADQYANTSLEEAVSTYITPKSATSYNDPYNQYREIRLAEDLKNNLSLGGGQKYANDNSAVDNGDHICSYKQAQQLRTTASAPPPANPPVGSTPFAQVFTDRKRAAVYKMIAEEIGRSWRSLGRELNIRQGKLDEFEMEYPRDLVSRVHKMLQAFEEDESHDPKRIVLTLCRALEDSRRKDLRRKVEEIMSH